MALFDDGRKGLVASHGRDLVCFDTRSGEALWTARVGLGASLAGEADAAVEAPCIVVDGAAFVGGYDGSVYAVAVADGTLRWTSAPCAGPIKGAATALDATTLVVGSHGGFVRAIALADGSVRRTSEPLGGAVFAAPTLAGEVLVVATTAGVGARAPGGDAGPAMAQSRRARVCATRGPRGWSSTATSPARSTRSRTQTAPDAGPSSGARRPSTRR